MNMPITNSWPNKTRMERLVERFVCNNTRCYTCGSLVYAVEKKKTTNHVYHNRCFRCRVCKRGLTEATLNEEGNDIYCTNCYRKKQRGDCSGLDFQRAAEERAQYVHNRRHPDQPPPKPNPQPPTQPGFSRQTSWNLRQLERQVLSNPGPITKKFETSNENNRQSVGDSHPLNIKTSYSAPTYLTNVRQYLSSIGNEPPPTAKFLPLYSPGFSSTTRTESTSRSPSRSPSTSRTASTSRTPPPPRTPTTFRAPFDFNRVKLQPNKLKLFNDFQPRLNKSSIDLSHARTPPTERKHSLISGGNQNYENKNRRLSEGRFYFPDTYITSNHRRSNSVNYSISPRKIQ